MKPDEPELIRTGAVRIEAQLNRLLESEYFHREWNDGQPFVPAMPKHTMLVVALGKAASCRFARSEMVASGTALPQNVHTELMRVVSVLRGPGERTRR
jgi:hypothetical protein